MSTSQSSALQKFLELGLIKPEEAKTARNPRFLPEEFAQRVVDKFGPATAQNSVEGVTASRILSPEKCSKLSPPRLLYNGPSPFDFTKSPACHPAVDVYESRVGKVFLGVRRITLILDKSSYFSGISSDASSWIAPAFADITEDIRLPGTAAVLFANGATLYSHWMFDLLPKLDVLRRAGWTPDTIDHFIVNGFNKGFQRETLARLGIPAKKVVALDGGTVSADRLLMVSPLRKSLRTPQWIIRFVRQLFGIDADKSDAEGVKLYISRAQAARRRITNDEDVRKLLESRNFKTVFAEKMSVEAFALQVSRCPQIVAPHGAGVMNVVFASRETRLLELFGAHISPEGWAMSAARGATHYLLAGEDSEGRYPWDREAYRGLTPIQRNYQDYRIDTGALRCALDVMDSESED